MVIDSAFHFAQYWETLLPVEVLDPVYKVRGVKTVVSQMIKARRGTMRTPPLIGVESPSLELRTETRSHDESNMGIRQGKERALI